MNIFMPLRYGVYNVYDVILLSNLLEKRQSHSEELRPIFFIFIQRRESFYLHMEFQTS